MPAWRQKRGVDFIAKCGHKDTLTVLIPMGQQYPNPGTKGFELIEKAKNSSCWDCRNAEVVK